MRLREQSVNCSVTSAARPNLGLENPTFFGGKMKFRQLPTCGYKGELFIFPLIFPSLLLSMPIQQIISGIIKKWTQDVCSLFINTA